MTIQLIKILLIILISAPFSLVYCTPVFFWQANVIEKPVFPQIKKEEFLAALKPLVENKTVVAFTYKLLLNDFQCQTCFPYLSQQTPSITYANVQNPAAALKTFNNTEELSVDKDGNLATPINCTTDKLYIISLENLKGDKDSMKKCDDAIQKITTTLACPDAVYMFMGTIDPSKIVEPTGTLFEYKNLSIYIARLEMHEGSKVQKYQIKDINVIKKNDTLLKVELETNQEASELSFDLQLKKRYFEIKHFEFKYETYRVIDLYAPQTNSYSCGKMVLRSKDVIKDYAQKKNAPKFVINKLQIQYGRHKEGTHFHFHDAWTCEGFVTPAIISAIFVTALLIGILSCGISMLMNVQPPSKFDPPMGPYITINASD